jgi:hypothetical protein
VSEPRAPSVSVFRERREALAWLVSSWAGCLLALSVWAVMFRDQVLDPDPAAWVHAVGAIVVLGLGGAHVWGFWASADARRVLRQASHHRRLAWWERDRFASEQSALRLGWRPGLVTWAGRVLLLLAVVVTVAGSALVVVTW